MQKNKSLALVVFITIFVLVLCSCAPKVTDFNPKSGNEGTVVTVDGKNFKPSAEKNIVKFGDTVAVDVLEAKNNQIRVKVPAGAHTAQISVKTSWGTGYSEKEFIITGKGFALAIGLNQVDPAHYSGWSGNLTGCEPDAAVMADIAAKQGFQTETLLTAQATRGAVISKLKELADKMQAGNLLAVSYSGHGGQVPDQNGDEADGLDETWCLYDGQLLDDELYGAWAKFRPGIRILVFSDSCHSGTVLKMIRSDFEKPTEMRINNLERDWSKLHILPKMDRGKIKSLLVTRPEKAEKPKVPPQKAPADLFVSRLAPPKILTLTFQKNMQFYIKIGTDAPKENDPNLKVEASAILISGCKDDQSSADLGFNGLFTLMLKQVWNNGEFGGNYIDFQRAIRDKVLQVNSEQSPEFFTVGASQVLIEEFTSQKPYKIGS